MDKKKRNLIIITSTFTGLVLLWVSIVAIINANPSLYKDPGVRNANYTPAELSVAKEINDTNLTKESPITLSFESKHTNIYFSSVVTSDVKGITLKAFAGEKEKQSVTLDSENKEVNYKFSIDYFDIDKVVVSTIDTSPVTFSKLTAYYMK